MKQVTQKWLLNVRNPSLYFLLCMYRRKEKKKTRKKDSPDSKQETVKYRNSEILHKGFTRQWITIVARLLKIITCLFAARSVPTIAVRSLHPGIANGNSPLAHTRRLLRDLRTTGRARSSLLLLPLRSRDTWRTRYPVVMLDPRIRVARHRVCCTLQSHRPGFPSPS